VPALTAEFVGRAFLVAAVIGSGIMGERLSGGNVSITLLANSGIKAAAVPPKATQDFLETVLDLKSSSHRAYIPLLKRLGFLDPSNVPTQVYKDFRDVDQSGRVMAERLKEGRQAAVRCAHEYPRLAFGPSHHTFLARIVGAANGYQTAQSCTVLPSGSNHVVPAK
jgi:Family of unknown function (DUF5343)